MISVAHAGGEIRVLSPPTKLLRRLESLPCVSTTLHHALDRHARAVAVVNDAIVVRIEELPRRLTLDKLAIARRRTIPRTTMMGFVNLSLCSRLALETSCRQRLVPLMSDKRRRWRRWRRRGGVMNVLVLVLVVASEQVEVRSRTSLAVPIPGGIARRSCVVQVSMAVIRMPLRLLQHGISALAETLWAAIFISSFTLSTWWP